MDYETPLRALVHTISHFADRVSVYDDLFNDPKTQPDVQAALTNDINVTLQSYKDQLDAIIQGGGQPKQQGVTPPPGP